MQRTYQLAEIGPTRADAAMATLLVGAGRRQHFAAGAMVQRRGDAGDGFWFIETGAVSICRFGADGHVTVFAVLGAGDLFGELAHFAQLRRQVDAVAASDATLVRLDGRAIDRLLADEPEVARWLLRSLANQLRVSLDRIEADRQLSATVRVARTLAAMARREGPKLTLTQEALAQFVGVSRVTVGQILGRFARAGLISRGYGRIDVVDLGRLAGWAGAEGPLEI